MRRNLTISLDPMDWALVRASVKATGDTYSGFFRRLIQKAFGNLDAEPKITAKYRPLFAAHSDFLSRRAAVLANARRMGDSPA